MKLILKTKNLELTDPLREYIDKKLLPISKLLSKWELDRELILECEISRTTKHHHKGDKVYYAETNLDFGFKLIRANIYSDDPRRAIDQLKDTLQSEIKKLKDKLVK